MEGRKSKKKGFLVFLLILIIAGTGVLQFKPCPFPAAVSVFGRQQKQIAHRGLSSVYPELSEDAYLAAGLAGFYGAECDVHSTADGKLIIMHDDDVDRMTDGTGEIENLSYEMLCGMKLDFGSGIDNCANTKILLFSEYLEICAKYDMVPFIELKKLDIKYLPDMFSQLDAYKLRDKAVLISFSFDYLIAARGIDADMQMMYLSNKLKEDEVETCLEYDFGIDFDFLKLVTYIPAIKYAKEKGVTLAAWTVDSPLVADFLHLLGVDYITTNRLIP